MLILWFVECSNGSNDPSAPLRSRCVHPVWIASTSSIADMFYHPWGKLLCFYILFILNLCYVYYVCVSTRFIHCFFFYFQGIASGLLCWTTGEMNQTNYLFKSILLLNKWGQKISWPSPTEIININYITWNLKKKIGRENSGSEMKF